MSFPVLRGACLFLLGLLLMVWAVPVSAQGMPRSLTNQPKVCPGDPPGYLAARDCSFRMGLRLENFVTTSVTDQAMFSAVFFGLIAQAQNSPPEWKGGWAGFGDRVGTRYGQNMAKGLAQFTTGAILRDDPRHISYASDPKVRKYEPGAWPRVGHAFKDWLTVRKSAADGNGTRMPNLSLFAGAAASGFVGYAWYPKSLATPGQAGIRASYSLGTALLSSFYTEFRPEIGRVLGAIMKRRPPAQSTGAAQ